MTVIHMEGEKWGRRAVARILFHLGKEEDRVKPQSGENVEQERGKRPTGAKGGW